MKNIFIRVEGEQPISEQVRILVDRVDELCETQPLRLVIFVSPEDQQCYIDCREVITSVISERYGERAPVWSLISQPPFGYSMIAELWWEENIVDIDHKRVGSIPYITVQEDGVRRVMVGGLQSSLSNSIGEQSREVCDTIVQIAECEGLEIDDIVRQWNYIEQITSSDSEGQHYQLFNDARSELYNSCEWQRGYPAATGIGATYGGVVIDVDFVVGERVTPIDNELQVSAHKYSKGVLIGEHDNRSTPKFERAKLVGDLLYISGTAAIRGEESLVGVDAAEQTRITLSNIDELLRASECGNISSLRVYIKHRDDYPQIREVVESYAPNQAIYLFADICRDELLMEIEAIAQRC